MTGVQTCALPILVQLKEDIDKIEKEIEEKRNLKQEKKIIKQMENYSLIQHIRNIVEGRNNDELSLKVMDAGKAEFAKAGLSYRGGILLPFEYRGEILAGTSSQGQEIVTEQKLDLMGALRANSVLFNNANILSGLVGDVSIPVFGGNSVNWATETGSASSGDGTFSEVTLSPKRLTAYIDISKQFLIQDSLSANQMLINDLSVALVDKLEATILGVASGNTTQPAGLFYNPTYTFTGSTTWNSIVSMESSLASNNALNGNLYYIFHPSTLGVLKTTPKTSGTAAFIAENTLVNGYKYLTTTNLPQVNSDQKAALFCNLQDLVIGQWGGVDITVDPYSQSVNGKVRIVINAYFDAKVRRSASFAKAGLK